MNVFFSERVAGEELTLDGEESLHAIKVLRMRKGDRALGLDGKGGRYDLELWDAHPKRTVFKVIRKENMKPRPFITHIAIAPTKLNDRMEWFLEKATEIGIEEITPLICNRSERRKINHERFNKILTAAIKQSMNPYLPILHEPTPFSNFISREKKGFIAHCNTGFKTELAQINSDQQEYCFLIGPEGDFTEQEIHEAVTSGWLPVSLGDGRLRTETAGLVACMGINFIKKFAGSKI